MYAIIKAGGHQIRVSPGATVTIDRMSGDPGSEVTFDEVLFVAKDGGEFLAGAPFVANARVVAVIDAEEKGPKIRVFKKKRRKGMRKTKGHRSVLTRLRVTDIVV